MGCQTAQTNCYVSSIVAVKCFLSLWHFSGMPANLSLHVYTKYNRKIETHAALHRHRQAYRYRHTVHIVFLQYSLNSVKLWKIALTIFQLYMQYGLWLQYRHSINITGLYNSYILCFHNIKSHNRNGE